MPSDFLLVHQFIGGDFLGLQLSGRKYQLQEIWGAECGSVYGLQGRRLDWIIDQRQTRIECRIEITVLIVTDASIEMEIREYGKIALGIDPVTLLIAPD